MADTIDRQAAIDTLNEYFVRIGKLKRRGLTKGEKAISLDTVGAIKTLPSAQPTGRWEERSVAEIEDAGIGMIQCARCSCCHRYLTTSFLYYFRDYKFCPNCGARMEASDV